MSDLRISVLSESDLRSVLSGHDAHSLDRIIQENESEGLDLVRCFPTKTGPPPAPAQEPAAQEPAGRRRQRQPEQAGYYPHRTGFRHVGFTSVCCRICGVHVTVLSLHRPK